MTTKRIFSGAPVILCGLAVLAYAAVFGLHSLLSYLGAALVALLVYMLFRRYFPDRFLAVEVAPNTGNIACDQLILEARAALQGIHGVRQKLPADPIAERLSRIEALSQQMLEALGRQPELQSQLRTFLRYYLPTTQKLADAGMQILRTGTRGEAAQRTLARINEAFDMIGAAFEKQLDALDQFRYLNVETEIDVLRDLLSADGLFGETETVPSPDADPEREE